MSSPKPFVVLLVDDDHDVLGANARFLRLNGLEVIVADSAATAKIRLSEEAIDVIVTDLRMPNCNGLDFAAETRESRPLIPIIFFSGYAQVQDVVAAMQLGAVDFLEKPVDPDVLLATLEKLQNAHYEKRPLSRMAFSGLDHQHPLKMRVLAYEKYLIECSLIQHNGHIASVLDSLQVNRRTLNDKMFKLGIRRDDISTPPDEDSDGA